MRPHPFPKCRSLRLQRQRVPAHQRERLHRFSLIGRSGATATVLSLTLLIVTGCTRSPTPANQSTQAVQSANLNTAQLSQASPSSQASPRSQRFATDRQNQLDDLGYRDGYGDGAGGFPTSLIGIESQNITDPAEKKIYTDAYNRGYAAGKNQQPSPSPTSTVLPARKAELQRQGYQSGLNDAQSGFAANPDSSIAALGLTDPTEKQIYTTAYKAGYQRQPSPAPAPTLSSGALSQQGYQDGYADAQSSLPQDAGRGINLRGLVAAADQQAYTNGYSNGYQKYLNEQGGVVGGW